MAILRMACRFANPTVEGLNAYLCVFVLSEDESKAIVTIEETP